MNLIFKHSNTILVASIVLNILLACISRALMGDFVVSAKKGQRTPDVYYNMEKMLGTLIKKEVQVKVCGACNNARGLAIPELVEGVEIGSMKILVDWIKDNDKVISF